MHLPRISAPAWIVRRRTPGYGVDACAALADLADRLAVGPGATDGRAFLRALGREGAGVRSGSKAVLDLATAGRNTLLGSGFRPEFDDGSPGQVRHFVGTARAVSLFGVRTTSWLQLHVRRDQPDSPDGRLGDAAIDFATALLDGTLASADAGDWIRTRLWTGIR